MKKSKTTKKDESQLKHIAKPVIDKSGEKTKESKIYAKVNKREQVKSGRTEARPIKLKRGK